MAWRTRFAPAPTGYLHLGHVVNAIHVWGIARAFCGEVVLRIEDHDRTRCRAEYELALLDDLDWLGFVPDVGTTDSFRLEPIDHPQRQSNNDARYAATLDALTREGRTYVCTCTRKEIAERSPHRPGEEARYPGTCRNATHSSNESLVRPPKKWWQPVSPGISRLRSISPKINVGDVSTKRLDRIQRQLPH